MKLIASWVTRSAVTGQIKIDILLDGTDVVFMKESLTVKLPFTELFDAMQDMAKDLIDADTIAVRRRAATLCS